MDHHSKSPCIDKDDGVNNVCNHIENLQEKYKMSAKNIKSVLKRLYDPEVISKVLSNDTQGIPSLKFTRSKAGTSGKTAHDYGTQIPRAQRTFLNIDYEEEDAFDADYEPENDPTINEDDLEDESSSESETAISVDSDTLQKELENELELENAQYNADLQLDLDDMLSEEVSERLPWKYTRAKGNLNLTAASDALEEERRELFTQCHIQEVYSNVDPEYLGFCKAINSPNTVLPDDDDEEEFVPPTGEFDELDKERDEIRHDRATEITKRERVALFGDLTEAETELILARPEVPPEKIIDEITKRQRVISKAGQRAVIPETSRKKALGSVQDSCSLLCSSIKFRSNEITQLKMQLEQHVQLVTQFVVSCNFEDQLHETRGRFLRMLNELDQQYYTHGGGSIYDIANMADAIVTCHEMNKIEMDPNWNPLKNLIREDENSLLGSETSIITRSVPRPEVRSVIKESKAIIYPELALQCAMSTPIVSRGYFTKWDELLLMLGLVQFGHMTKHCARSIDGSRKRSALIARHLLPCKSAEQIERHMRSISKLKKNDSMESMMNQAIDGMLNVCFNFSLPQRFQGNMELWPIALQPYWLKNMKVMGSPVPSTPSLEGSPAMFCADTPATSSSSPFSSRDIPFTPRREEHSVLWSPLKSERCEFSLPISNTRRNLFSSESLMETVVSNSKQSHDAKSTCFIPEPTAIGNRRGYDEVSTNNLKRKKLARACQSVLFCEKDYLSDIALVIRSNELIISKIKSDICLRLSLHNEIRKTLYELFISERPSSQMWVAIQKVLLPLHEHILCLLSFLFPKSSLPASYFYEPLRLSYERAFEMLIMVDKCSIQAKPRTNYKQYLKLLVDIYLETNDDQGKLSKRLEKLFSNQPTLVKEIKRRSPWFLFDRKIEAQEVECIDLTLSYPNDTSLTSEINIFEKIDDVSTALSTKSLYKKGATCGVSNGEFKICVAGKYVDAELSYLIPKVKLKERADVKEATENAMNSICKWTLEDDTFLVNTYNEIDEGLDEIVSFAAEKLDFPKDVVAARLNLLISLQQSINGTS